MFISTYINVHIYAKIKMEIQITRCLWGLEYPTKLINESKILLPNETGHTDSHTHLTNQTLPSSSQHTPTHTHTHTEYDHSPTTLVIIANYHSHLGYTGCN